MVAPALLENALNGLRTGLVVITGSSGKSTTTKLLVRILRAHGLRVFSNSSTANIRQGLVSDLLADLAYSGAMRSDIAVLEMDEAHGARILEGVVPSTVVLTNIGTDQIDRFHDPREVALLLRAVARTATGSVVTNADDAMLEEIVSDLGSVAVHRYGLSSDVFGAMKHGTGSARTSTDRLHSGTIVVSVEQAMSTIRHAGRLLTVALPARGAHYAVDVAAAIAAASAILGDSFEAEWACLALLETNPVFGRNQLVSVRGKPVEFVLVQNPASFQLNLDFLPQELEQVMVAVGSDVRDFSYLWPVDTSTLARVAVASGTLAEELALQLVYRGVVVERVDPDLNHALDEFVALPPPSVGVKTIIFSADAMRKTRRHFGLA
jgi:UDP-N-acetylmuramyl pentapeptide synthase